MVFIVDNTTLESAAAFDLTRTTRKAISRPPVIDLSPFTNGGSPSERRETARQIREACVDIGFFYITGHGFTADEISQSMEWGHRFFELPLEAKMQVAARNNSASLGFIQTGGLNPEANADSRVDLKERFYSSRELAPGEIEDEASPAGRSQWPSEEALPGFTAFMKDQTRRKVALAKAVCRAFALSLGLPEDYLVDFHDRMGCIHSLNYYPAIPEGAEPNWGFSPHSDYGSFTILAQDESGGLEARNADGEWVGIPPLPGTMVVNIGDLLQRWTNDVYVSSLHRVLNRGRSARMSIAFFVYANPRARIGCLETCQSESRPNRFSSVISGEYIKELLTQAYLTGRTGVSERTAERLRDEH